MHVRKRPNSFISFAATNRSILALEIGISMAGLTELPSKNKTAVSLLGLAWKLGKCLLIGLTYDMCTVNTSRDRGLLLMYKLKKYSEMMAHGRAKRWRLNAIQEGMAWHSPENG